MTYDAREYEWLRVFLEVVTWMEKEFEFVKTPPENGEQYIKNPKPKRVKNPSK